MGRTTFVTQRRVTIDRGATMGHARDMGSRAILTMASTCSTSDATSWYAAMIAGARMSANAGSTTYSAPTKVGPGITLAPRIRAPRAPYEPHRWQAIVS